ncbi:MAG: hypothetical protein Q4F57_06465 [Weeksellaceae bacterium]|nr:hypothetical protein [Weeksellaceae bacterium]
MNKFIYFGVIISALLFFTSASDHEFQTSTTKVELNDGSNALTFHSKFVTADLEKAVGVSSTNADQFNRAVESYLKRNFVVKINNETKTFKYHTAQTSPKATRLYFEIPNVTNVRTIEIRNSMLISEFAQQQNFMTFNILGKRDNFVTKRGSETGRISL